MFLRRLRRLSCLGFSLFLMAAALAGQQSPVSNLRYRPDLRVITRASAAIFSGTVIAVRHVPVTQGNQLETVEIIFHVEQAVRGATPGERLAIREWAGLWSVGERYKVGERVLLFLYPTSKLGLTSPVGGAMGRFAIDAHGRVALGEPGIGADSQTGVSDSAPPSADAALPPKGRVSSRDFLRAIRRAAEE
jgi:hypothetical protein